MERTWKPLTAGILSIISGGAAIGMGALILFFRGVLGRLDWGGWLGQRGGFLGPGMMGPGMMGPGMMGSGFMSMFTLGASIALIVAGIIAVIGGIYAIKRRHWGLALAGSILAVAGIPPLGVLSIIFVSLGRREFTRHELPTA